LGKEFIFFLIKKQAKPLRFFIHTPLMFSWAAFTTICKAKFLDYQANFLDYVENLCKIYETRGKLYFEVESVMIGTIVLLLGGNLTKVEKKNKNKHQSK
jgi:hypothetical protein